MTLSFEYVAGFFDGEGYVGVHRNSESRCGDHQTRAGSLRISLYRTDA